MFVIHDRKLNRYANSHNWLSVQTNQFTLHLLSNVYSQLNIIRSFLFSNELQHDPQVNVLLPTLWENFNIPSVWHGMVWHGMVNHPYGTVRTTPLETLTSASPADTSTNSLHYYLSGRSTPAATKLLME